MNVTSNPPRSIRAPTAAAVSRPPRPRPVLSLLHAAPVHVTPLFVAAVCVAALVGSCGHSGVADPLDATHLPRLRLTELSRVGGNDQRKAYMLSSVATAAVLDPDSWALIDGESKQIRVFGTDGVVRRTMGGEGKGPGQFSAPVALGVPANGDVVVWDMTLRRTTTFDGEGKLVATAALPTGDPMEVLSSMFVGMFPDGSWVLQVGANPMKLQSAPEGPWRDTLRFRHISADGSVLGEIAALPGPARVVMRSGGMTGPQTPIFGRQLVAAVAGDTLLVGVTDSLHLWRFLPDGTALPPLTFHRPVRPATKKDIDGERAHLVRRAEDFGSHMPASFPKNLVDQETKRMVDAAKTVLAESTWPAFTALKTGPGAETWIRDTSPPDSTTTRWIRFDADFHPQGWVELPGKDVLLGVGDGLVLVRTSDAMDVQTVVCYRVGGA